MLEAKRRLVQAGTAQPEKSWTKPMLAMDRQGERSLWCYSLL